MSIHTEVLTGVFERTEGLAISIQAKKRYFLIGQLVSSIRHMSYRCQCQKHIQSFNTSNQPGASRETLDNAVIPLRMRFPKW